MSLGTRWRRFWQSDKANAAEDLVQWSQRATPDGIRLLFLMYLKKGNNLWPPAVEPPEIEYFQAAVSGLALAPDGQIQPQSVIRYLTQAHTTKISAIQRAASLIEALITAHAHFPFSAPVKLTEDSFCRAILLLTNRCQQPFEQAEGGGIRGVSSDYIRKRPDERRLAFLHSALLRRPTGIPTHDDILDVLCRTEYPAAVRGKDRVLRRPVAEFVPLAERLEPAAHARPVDEVPISQLKLFWGIVSAFPSPRAGRAVAVNVADEYTAGSLSATQFVEWATKVQLLDSLDQLFSVFLCPVTEN